MQQKTCSVCPLRPGRLQHSPLSLLSFLQPAELPSHDGAAFGLVLAEGGGEEVGLAGQV